MAFRAAQVVAALTQGTPLLTKSSLERANSVFANAIREYQATEKADKLAEALKELGEEMPAKTKEQIRKDSMGMSPMKRFESSSRMSNGAVFDEKFWQKMIQWDQLAAEIERLLQTK